MDTTDDEIKDMVTKTLEAQGVLGQIKAQLRAAVFNAIHQDSTLNQTKSKQSMLSTPHATLALHIIIEFLRHFHLPQTLSVLIAEASCTEAERNFDRKEAQEALHLPFSGSTTCLLIDLLAHQTQELSSASSSSLTAPKKSGQDPLPSLKENPSKSPLPTIGKPQKGEEVSDSYENKELRKESTSEKPRTLDISEAKAVSTSKTLEITKDVTTSQPAPTFEDDEDDGELVDADEIEESMASMDEYSMDASVSPVKPVQTESRAVEEDNEPLDSHPITTPKPAQEDEAEDPNEAARLAALDAKLKAMEAEDATGTLKQLKASLQTELEAKSDDDQYGSDFDEDFEEDIASDVEEESLQEEDEELPSFKPSPHDKPVSSGAALDAYDYVEAVVKP